MQWRSEGGGQRGAIAPGAGHLVAQKVHKFHDFFYFPIVLRSSEGRAKGIFAPGRQCTSLRHCMWTKVKMHIHDL